LPLSKEKKLTVERRGKVGGEKRRKNVYRLGILAGSPANRGKKNKESNGTIGGTKEVSRTTAARAKRQSSNTNECVGETMSEKNSVRGNMGDY